MVGDPSDDIPPVAPGVPTDSAGSVVGTGEAPLDLGYTVTVDSFSGPLDLLLYLVRRTELDILEVPLSLIVDQFVDTVRSWQDADLDVAGEFILMAATLLELKARTIAPPLEQPEEGAEDEPAFDPRESLLKSLLAYRRFKEASQVLDGLEERRRPLLERQVREHIPEAPPEEGDFELGEIDLSLLATTCERILSRIGGLGPRTVVVDEMPLGVRIATMLDELSARERATIRELLEGNHSRVVHITTVMATLELARQRFIEVAQYEQFGDISLRLRTAEERERQPELPPPEPEGPKRRRKLPLVTWHPPAQSAEAAAAAASNADDESAADAAIEESTETDEQRFLRELEEATRVTAVLALTADVEKSFTEHWYTLHPELRPVAPPTPPPPEPVAKRFPNRRPPGERRPADKPPAETPAAEQPAAPAAGAPATTETPVPVAGEPVATEPVAVEKVAAEPVATEPVAVEKVATEAVAAAAVAPTTPVEATTTSTVTTPVADAVPVVADDRAATAAATPPVTDVEAVAPAQPAEVAPVAAIAPVHPAPVAASAPLSETVNAAAAPVVEIAAPVEAPAPVIAEVSAPSPAPAETPAAEATPVNVVAEAVVAPVSESVELVSAAPSLVTQSPEPVAPATPPAPEPVMEPTVAATSAASEPQAVLAVEHWPVMHAQPVPEEAPHPLDTVTSDDPSAVNELLSDVPRRASQPRDEDEHEDDEDEIDPDELLADDPALVNAALQADKPRPVVERRPVPEAIIPAATETTVWTAPVDRGQTASEIDADDDVAAVTPPAPADDAPAVVVSTSPTEQLTAEATQPMVASPNVETEPSAPAAVEVSDEAVAAAVAMMRPTAEPPSAAVASSTVASSTTIPEPTPSTEPLVVAAPTTSDVPETEATAGDFEPDEVVDLAAEDPALVDAAAHADSVRPPVEHRPVHDLVIPAATETTIYTAPVDRGQTTSDDVTDEESATAEESVAPESVVSAPEVPATVAPAAEPTSTVVASDSVVAAANLVAPAAAAESVPDVAVAASAALVAPAASAATSSDVIAEPTPTTAPLVLSEPAPVPAVALTEPPTLEPSLPAAVAEPSPPPNEAAPPGPDGPPPAPRSDSPLPAPTTTPTPNRPMSPPPRSKAWLQIAILIAILSNAGWGLATWLLWVPRDVLEVIATERGGTPEHETLTWRFNLDVVDAQGRAKAPELVPVISPAIAGRWSWSDSRTLVFDAAAPLPLATTFTAALPAERFHSAQGFRLRSPVQQTWSTPALAVTAATVETFDHSGTTIAVTFNQPVDPVAIAQRLIVEVTPADEATDDLSKDLPALLRVVAGDAAPAPVADAPATAVPATDTPAAANPAAETAPGTPAVVATPAPAVAPAAVAPAAEPAAKTPVVATVKAISTTVDRIARLQIALPQRGTARLRLPAGTTGVGGPLGLAATWEQPVALQQTLHLVSATPAVPSHGEVRVDVMVSDVKAPRQLLAPAVSVEPAIPVTISTTDQGLSLVGAFVPGETYHIRCAATWPDDSATSGHQLAAYTAASDLTVTIPERPAGIWPLDQAPIDGQVRFAAQAVERADVMVLGEDEECLASSEATWIGMMPVPLDLDTLTAELPPATYRLRVTTSGEAAVKSEQHLLIEQVRVRPQALISALTDWMLASLAGDDAADVAVRVVRVADIPPVTPKGP